MVRFVLPNVNSYMYPNYVERIRVRRAEYIYLPLIWSSNRDKATTTIQHMPIDDMCMSLVCVYSAISSLPLFHLIIHEESSGWYGFTHKPSVFHYSCAFFTLLKRKNNI